MTPRPQTCVFIATSLDGFIARPDGRLDWLMQAQAAAPAGEDFGYAAFMAGIDALVMGRKTLDTVRGFDPWPVDAASNISPFAERRTCDERLRKLERLLGTSSAGELERDSS